MPANAAGNAYTDNPVSTASGAAPDPASTTMNLNTEFPWYQLSAQVQNNNNNYALQAAQNKAQAAYQSKLVELQKQGLGQQAQQIAQSYALEQAKLEFEKQQFAQTFGAQQANSAWQQGFDKRQQDLDDAYKTAEQTGFRDGVPTLASIQTQNQNNQFNANLAQQNSQFNTTNAFNLQQLGQNNSQFNTTSAFNQQQLDQANQQFLLGQGLSYAQLNAQQAQFGAQQQNQSNQFNQTLGEGQRQFDINTGNQVDQFGRTLSNQQHQFDVTTGNQVDQYGRTLAENQRQFNTSSVLNAPRGPADWAAYENRMRGLQASGSLPGNLSSFGSVAPAASFSNGGQATGPVLSNTDLALAATGQGDPAKLQGTVWQGMYGNNASGGGQPPSSSGGGSSDPYGGGNSAYGGPAGGATAQGQGQGSTADISLPSLQKYRRFAPTEQAMGLGYISENGGPTAEDSQYQMQRSAPNMAQSRQARYAGM